MSNLGEQLKINLNQNLWGLVIGLVSLGAAERYELCALYWLSLVISMVMVLSVTATTLAYTINYWKQKQG